MSRAVHGDHQTHRCRQENASARTDRLKSGTAESSRCERERSHAEGLRGRSDYRAPGFRKSRSRTQSMPPLPSAVPGSSTKSGMPTIRRDVSLRQWCGRRKIPPAARADAGLTRCGRRPLGPVSPGAGADRRGSARRSPRVDNATAASRADAFSPARHGWRGPADIRRD
jgi:hypothetical protein